VSFPLPRKVEDLQFRVEEESITKGDLEVIPNTLSKMWGQNLKLHVRPHWSRFFHLLLNSKQYFFFIDGFGPAGNAVV